jgi:hypothetical protein
MRKITFYIAGKGRVFNSLSGQTPVQNQQAGCGRHIPVLPATQEAEAQLA